MGGSGGPPIGGRATSRIHLVYPKGGDAHVEDQLAHGGGPFTLERGRVLCGGGWEIGDAVDQLMIEQPGSRSLTLSMTPGTRTRFNMLVLAVALGAGATMLAASRDRSPFPGWWPLGAFVVVATLLEGALTTRLRIRG